MLFKLSASGEREMQHLPETGMGYQIVEATLVRNIRWHFFAPNALLKYLYCMQKLQLPNRFIDLLINLPENGMGYQIVNVFLRNGHILRQHKVLNSSLLLLEENEKVDSSEIERIELQKGTLK